MSATIAELRCDFASSYSTRTQTLLSIALGLDKNFSESIMGTITTSYYPSTKS